MVIQLGCKWRIGVGTQVSFWSDWWVGKASVNEQIGVSSVLSQPHKVADFMDHIESPSPFLLRQYGGSFFAT